MSSASQLSSTLGTRPIPSDHGDFKRKKTNRKPGPLTFESFLKVDEATLLIVPFLGTTKKREGILKWASRDIISLSQASKSVLGSLIDFCNKKFFKEMPHLRNIQSLAPAKMKLIEDVMTLWDHVKNPEHEKIYGSYLRKLLDCERAISERLDLSHSDKMSTYIKDYCNSLVPGLSDTQRSQERSFFSFMNRFWGIGHQMPEAIEILNEAFQTNKIVPILPFLPNFALEIVVKRAAELEFFEILNWFAHHKPNLLKKLPRQAAENGQIDLLEWILNKTNLFPSYTGAECFSITYAAIKNGHFQVLEWLNQQPTLRHFLRVKNQEGKNLAHLSLDILGECLDLFHWLYNQPDLAYLLEEKDTDGWNIAHFAACNEEDLDILEWISGEERLAYLLKQVDASGGTIAHHAAKNDNLEVLDWILEKEDLKPLLKTLDHQGRNIAHAAAESDEGNAIEWILQKPELKPQLYVPDREGKNLATIAACDGDSPSQGIWNMLSQQPTLSHLILFSDPNGQEIVRLASLSGNAYALEWMASQDQLANRFLYKDPKGRTLVHLAAMAGKFVTLHWFYTNPKLRHLLDSVDQEGHNFLQLAVIEDRAEVIQWIAENPVLAHFFQSKNSLGRNLVELALVHGRLNVLKAIASIPELLPLFNVKWAGRNVAHVAAMYGNTEILHWMSENLMLAPLLKELDVGGLNLAHIAAVNNRVEVLKWLSSHKKLKPLLFAVCPDGLTLAEIAKRYGSEDVLQWTQSLA